MSRSLVIVEVLLCVTILIAAAVIIIGAFRASNADFGARLANTHTARISLPDARYSGAAEQLRFAEDLRRSLIRNDSTGGVAIMSSLPGTYTNWPKYEVDEADTARESDALYSDQIFGKVVGKVV